MCVYASVQNRTRQLTIGLWLVYVCVCVPLTRTEQDTHTGGGGDGGVGQRLLQIQLQITICVKVVKEDTGEEYSLVAGMEGGTSRTQRAPYSHEHAHAALSTVLQ